MINLNDDNKASIYTMEAATIVRDRFDNPVGAEFGCPWGGGVEAIGKLWKKEGGTIYGLDTFAGHPKQLSYSLESHEAFCMDDQYKRYGTEGLSYEYQRKELDRQGLSNVKLIKGLINETSLKSNGINHLHYALLDLDLVNSMLLAYTITNPIMVKGGFLCLHDVTPRGHILGLWGLYQEIMASGEYRLIKEVPESYIAVLEKL